MSISRLRKLRPRQDRPSILQGKQDIHCKMAEVENASVKKTLNLVYPLHYFAHSSAAITRVLVKHQTQASSTPPMNATFQCNGCGAASASGVTPRRLDAYRKVREPELSYGHRQRGHSTVAQLIKLVFRT